MDKLKQIYDSIDELKDSKQVSQEWYNFRQFKKVLKVNHDIELDNELFETIQLYVYQSELIAFKKGFRYASQLFKEIQ